MTAVMGIPMPWSCLQAEEQPRRPRIDRSMISGPSNFQHTGHIGSAGDPNQLNAIKTQMQSKSGITGEASAPKDVSTPMPTLSLDEARAKFGTSAPPTSQ